MCQSGRDLVISPGAWWSRCIAVVVSDTSGVFWRVASFWVLVAVLRVYASQQTLFQAGAPTELGVGLRDARTRSRRRHAEADANFTSPCDAGCVPFSPSCPTKYSASSRVGTETFATCNMPLASIRNDCLAQNRPSVSRARGTACNTGMSRIHVRGQTAFLAGNVSTHHYRASSRVCSIS